MLRTPRPILFAFLLVFVSAWAAAKTDENAAAASGDPDAVIDSVLTVSGLKESLERLPKSAVAGFMEGAEQGHASPELKESLVKLAKSAYPADGFTKRVTDALRASYDPARFKHLRELLSGPLATRMAQLEHARSSAEEVRAFRQRLAAQALPAARVALLKDLDEASGASELLTSVTLSSIESMAMAAVGNCPDKQAELKAMLAQKRLEIGKGLGENIRFRMAYAYRDVSDADLRSYLDDVYRDKDLVWMLGITRKAMAAEFKAGAERLGSGFAEILKSQGKPNAAAANCGAAGGQVPAMAAKAAEGVPAPSETMRRPAGARALPDARQCLEFQDNAKVRACAEKFR